MVTKNPRATSKMSEGEERVQQQQSECKSLCLSGKNRSSYREYSSPKESDKPHKCRTIFRIK